jgi:choline-sulfatase
MVVSLINPHDICYMAIRDFAETEREKMLLENGDVELATLDEALKMPEGISEEEFFEEYCPPLPPNYEPQQGEPGAIRVMLEKSNFRNNARDHYGDEEWRMHRWAYCRLTEVVDAQIQVILDALKESGQEENTLILFSSDHGDMDASHRMEHKSTLYEESANVPFLAMWKGHIPAARVDSTHLVSTGLDLLPTVCDYAGIAGVADPRGKSLRPLFEGKPVEWRKYLGVESQIGKMVVDAGGYKYIRYDVAGTEEQILDLNRDPYETTHFTDSIGYSDKLRELREVYETEWFPEK